MSAVDICRRFRVHGHVQGVFFRASTRDTALRLRLSGWVRNAENGDVELVACGPSDAVEQLAQWLRRGPSEARVDQVDAEDIAMESHTGFLIRY